MPAGASATWAWSFEPLQVAPILAAAVLHGLRARRLARRGRPIALWRAASFGLALFLLLAAVVSPVDQLGEERLFSAHMIQHILIGDLAPLFAVLGLTGPVLRPVLALGPVGRLRALGHPLVALPLWAGNLYLWHVPLLYDAALDHTAVHALEHACFFAGGAILWTALLEPLPGPAWFTTGTKLAYIAAYWIAGGALAQVFLWSGRAYYSRYVDAPRVWGLSAVGDQRIGGGLMLLEGTIVTLGLFAWLFLRWFAENDRHQALLDAGVDPVTAARVVRYGRR